MRYRYATAALVGKRRESEHEAAEDAIRLGLAFRQNGQLHWRVEGRIQRDDTMDGSFGLPRAPGNDSQ